MKISNLVKIGLVVFCATVLFVACGGGASSVASNSFALPTALTMAG